MSKKLKITLTVIAAVTLALAIAAIVVFCRPKKIADVSIENAGKSYVLETELSPEEVEATGAENVAFAFIYNMSKLESYKMTSEGESVASLFGGYHQKVADTGYKYGNMFYSRNTSSSTFANVDHEAFVMTSDGTAKVAYRNKGGDISVLDRDGSGGYKSVYGVSPDDLAIGGYIFNRNTVKSAERMEENSKYPGDLRYRFVLECSDEATAFMKKQMVIYGELSAVPEFSVIEFEITISRNWEPREIYSHVEYSTKKQIGGDISFTCDQKVTATYTRVNGITENPIPDAAKFSDAIGFPVAARRGE